MVVMISFFISGLSLPAACSRCDHGVAGKGITELGTSLGAAGWAGGMGHGIVILLDLTRLRNDEAGEEAGEAGEGMAKLACFSSMPRGGLEGMVGSGLRQSCTLLISSAISIGLRLHISRPAAPSGWGQSGF